MAIITEEHGRLLSTKEVAVRLSERAGGIRNYTTTGVNRMVSKKRLVPREKIAGANFFLPADVEELKISPQKGNPTTRQKKGIADTGVSRKVLANQTGIAESTIWNAFHQKPISKSKADLLLAAFNAIRQEQNQESMTFEQLEWNVIDI